MILYFWRYVDGAYIIWDAIDYASSVIWVSRYNEPGEFEIRLRADRYIRQLVYTTASDVFITRKDSRTAMVVERVHLESDMEDGDYLTISGRSVKSILSRRVATAWDPEKRQYLLTYSGYAEQLLRKLITDNIISPDALQSWRAIDSFTLAPAQGYTDSIEAQLLGENLLDVVQAVCAQFGWGFRLEFDGGFHFSIYKGVDRSKAQSSRPFVVFSPKMQNVSSVEWIMDKSPYKSICHIGGEGDGAYRKQAIAGYRAPQGLQTVEMWYDGSGISSKIEDGETMTDEAYMQLLRETAATALAENKRIFQMETEALPDNGYIFGVDYDLGDIVTCGDSYGVEANCRVQEIREVEDASGYRLIPILHYEG